MSESVNLQIINETIAIDIIEEKIEIKFTESQGPAGAKGDDGDQGDKGDKGDKGDTGTDANFEQSFTYSSSVVVVHNLGKNPAVTVIDSAGTKCQGSVVYDSLSQLTVTFSAPFTGKIILN